MTTSKAKPVMATRATMVPLERVEDANQGKWNQQQDQEGRRR